MQQRISKQRGVSPTVHRCRSIAEFVGTVQMRQARDLVSAGYIASKFGISRQAVHQAIRYGNIEAWYVEGGYVFVSEKSCDRFWKRDTVLT